MQGKEYGELAEGVATTTALLNMSHACGVELPICSAVDQMINQKKNSDEVLSNLFLRSLKMEF